jgi:hypothetical protein
MLGFQFISVRQNSPQFNPTAEVTAEVNPCAPCKGSKQNCRYDGNAAEVLLKYC